MTARFLTYTCNFTRLKLFLPQRTTWHNNKHLHRHRNRHQQRIIIIFLWQVIVAVVIIIHRNDGFIVRFLVSSSDNRQVSETLRHMRLLHCALASCDAAYCNRSCLCVCVFATGGRAGGRCPNLTTASARSVCVTLSAFFIDQCRPLVPTGGGGILTISQRVIPRASYDEVPKL